MEMRHFKMLRTLAQTGSVSAAAVVLGTSQPRLTQQLRQVEEELGATLFHRSGKGLTLSEAGQTFLPHAKKIESAYESATAALWQLRGEAGRSLRLGISITASMQLVPANLLAFHKRYPEIHVSVTRADPRLLVRGLEAGNLDLCIGLELPDSPIFVREEVFTSRMVGFSARSLGLAETVTLKEFCERELVLPPRSCGTRVVIDDALRRNKVKPRILMEVDDVSTILNVVKSGEAVAILPSAVPSVSKLLVMSTFRDFSGEVKGCILHPRRLTPEAETFVKIIRDRVETDTNWNVVSQ